MGEGEGESEDTIVRVGLVLKGRRVSCVSF